MTAATQHHRQPDHDLAPRAPADQRVDEHQDVDHRVEAHVRDPARQGRQPQHHRGAERHHDAGQRPGTPPQQHRREPDRHDRRERPPGDVVAEDSLEQRRHHQHPDQHPVAPHPAGRVGGAGLGPQRAQGGGDHPPSLGSVEASGTGRKDETPLLPTAEAGPASTPMCPGRRSASVEPPGAEAGLSSKEKIHVTVALSLGTLVGYPSLDRHRGLGAPLGPGRRRRGRLRAQLDDSMAAPGTDSQAAPTCSRAPTAAPAGSRPMSWRRRQDAATFVDSRQARVGLDQLKLAVGDLPNVLGTTREVSPDGRVALVRVQYPVIERARRLRPERAQGRPGGLEGCLVVAAARSRRRPVLRFEEPPASAGRADRPGRRGDRSCWWPSAR